LFILRRASLVLAISRCVMPVDRQLSPQRRRIAFGYRLCANRGAPAGARH
jgi:hypothetical protein